MRMYQYTYSYMYVPAVTFKWASLFKDLFVCLLYLMLQSCNW